MSDTLVLPLDAVTQTFAFLARRGAGKSYGSMKLAEGMLDAKAQTVALDPVGVWYGLRIAEDGEGAGYDLPILGGLHGDIPLEPGAGALIADLVVDRGISVVLDVSMFSKQERKQFATDFAERLFHRKKRHRSPLHLFIEEAQMFVPQRVSQAEARMLGAFEDLIKLGRNFGIGVTLISQRPQSVNKDALNQTEALFALQTNGAQERKALTEWIVEQGIETKDIVKELPSLPTGTAYLWSPSWLRRLEKVEIGKRKTYNASATPTVGHEHVEPKPLSAAELSEVEKAMAATIAKAKADDPRELRKHIHALQEELKSRSKTVEKRIEVEVPVEIPVLPDSLAEELRSICAEIGDSLQRFASIAKRIEECVSRAGVRTLKAGEPKGQSAPSPERVTRLRQQASLESAERRLSKAERSILTVLAQYREPMSLQRIAILAGYTAGTGGFNNALGSLRSSGYILRGDPARITDDGLAALGEFERLPVGDELRAYWLARLGKAERAILGVLLDVHPAAMASDELAVRAGYTPKTGGFNNALGRLRTMRLAEGYGEVKAADAFFETM